MRGGAGAGDRAGLVGNMMQEFLGGGIIAARQTKNPNPTPAPQ